jgi:hypothetical protein
MTSENGILIDRTTENYIRLAAQRDDTQVTFELSHHEAEALRRTLQSELDKARNERL